MTGAPLAEATTGCRARCRSSSRTQADEEQVACCSEACGIVDCECEGDEATGGESGDGRPDGHVGESRFVGPACAAEEDEDDEYGCAAEQQSLGRARSAAELGEVPGQDLLGERAGDGGFAPAGGVEDHRRREASTAAEHDRVGIADPLKARRAASPGPCSGRRARTA